MTQSATEVEISLAPAAHPRRPTRHRAVGLAVAVIAAVGLGALVTAADRDRVMATSPATPAEAPPAPAPTTEPPPSIARTPPPSIALDGGAIYTTVLVGPATNALPGPQQWVLSACLRANHIEIPPGAYSGQQAETMFGVCSAFTDPPPPPGAMFPPDFARFEACLRANGIVPRPDATPDLAVAKAAFTACEQSYWTSPR